MKKKNLLLILVPVAAMMLTLVGCSDYDNGFTESAIQFDKNFSNKFASIDPEQDWNLAERASLTVITSTPREIMVYSEINGTYYILGDFEKVTGTRELSFDTYEGTTMVVVSDGETAMRAFVGGTVNFDDNTSVADKVQETRSHDVNRNEYEKKGYIIPANITDEERAAVIEAFSIPHYGAVNTVTIPWDAIWVQQVYRSGYAYTAGNGGTVVGSDHMDHLQLYNNNVAEDATKGGRYEHVNDFNAADHNSSWQDIVGLTLMYNIDATNVVTEEITNVYGQKVNWVKQWSYNNTEDSKYHCDYIYKMVNGNLYIGFDFYSHHGDGEADNKNEDVERDWVFNDWILKVAPAMGTNVPQEDIPDASPLAWVLACEDLGSTDDIDYNDVVVKVEHEAGQTEAYITPLAAGGTLASYLYFTSTIGKPVCVGEIHQLFNLSGAVSGSYPVINAGSGTASAPQRYPISVGKDWSIACYSTSEWDVSKQTTGSNMGGFFIKVLPRGTAAAAKTLEHDSYLYEENEPSVVQSPEPGRAPYILCLPSSYIKMSGNTKTANPWCWPGERKYINDAYSTFGGWVEDHNTNKDWYTHPNSSYVVDASAIPTISSTIVSEVVNDEFDQETLATITTLYNNLNVPTWVRTEIPTPTLTLKQGISEILLATGETIDLYRYIDTNFPIYCTLSETGDINYANDEHSSVMGVGQGGKTVTIAIHQYSSNGANLDVTARTVRAYHYDNSGTIEMDGKTIEIGAGQTYYIGTEWDNNYVSFECTKNNNNISTNINGNSIEVIAGNNVGAETTLTFTFTSKNNSSQSKTLTANFKVVENNNGGNGNEDPNLHITENGNTITSKTMTVDDIVYLSCEYPYDNSEVPTFSSSDENVVKAEHNGNHGMKITAVSGGTATITITLPQASGYKAASTTIQVTVNRIEPTFNIYKTNNWEGTSSYSVDLQLPNGTHQINLADYNTLSSGITYSSNNTSVATVSNSGLITAKGAGTATITVTSPQTSVYNAKTATVTVTVKQAAQAVPYTSDTADDGDYRKKRYTIAGNEFSNFTTGIVIKVDFGDLGTNCMYTIDGTTTSLDWKYGSFDINLSAEQVAKIKENGFIFRTEDSVPELRFTIDSASSAKRRVIRK